MIVGQEVVVSRDEEEIIKLLSKNSYRKLRRNFYHKKKNTIYSNRNYLNSLERKNQAN